MPPTDPMRPEVNSVGAKTAPDPSLTPTAVNITSESGRKFGIIARRPTSRVKNSTTRRLERQGRLND